MKKCVIYISLLLSLNLRGQSPVLNDTIRIKEVVISSRMTPGSPAGFKTEHIDSMMMNSNAFRDLGDILSGTGTLYIKSYGPGGIATPSFRGTGAAHTILTWNGINISNPMLSQSDFSLIPAGISDEVLINYGSFGSNGTIAGLGGSVDLVNKPDWKTGTDISLSARAGSFSRYSGDIKILTGNSVFQSSTKANLSFYGNNFPFTNRYTGAEPVLQHRSNSGASSRGLLQEFYFSGNRYSLSARAWYQSSYRNLPQPVIALSNNKEHQLDEALRTIIDLRSARSGKDAFLTLAGVFTRLNYVNALAGIDSRNATGNYILRSGFSIRTIQFINLRFVVENDLAIVRSNNYSGNKERNIATVSLIADSKTGKRLNYSFLLREKADGDKLLIPDFSAGADLRITQGYEHFVTAGISRNSRFPSLNELYWNPGGNPALKSEVALGYEIGYRGGQKFGNGISISSSSDFFFNDITDMIWWHPGSSNFWIPENLRDIHTYGIESDLQTDYKGERSVLALKLSWSLTKSVLTTPGNEYPGKQLLYIPVNQAFGYLNYTTEHFYSSLQTIFTDRRFISSDNSEWLPGYSVVNFINGFKFRLGTGKIDLNLKIDNLFSAYYEPVAYYPYPGRSFFITVTYNYSNR